MSTIREANASDIPTLYEFWYDRLVLEQQQGRSIQLVADPSDKWKDAAQNWLTDKDIQFWVISKDDMLVGCIVAKITDNEPGILPEKIGIIRELLVDLHTKQSQGGLGKQLFEVAVNWFEQNNIEKIKVAVSRHSAVEQAFWRGVGAKHRQDIFEWDL